MSSSILPLRISVSTHGFGPCGGSSILSGVTKMVIWPSGLGVGLQNLSRGFESYYHLNRRVVRDQRRLISDFRMVQHHYSVLMFYVVRFLNFKFEYKVKKIKITLLA